MLQDGDLTPLERALCSAAALGRLLDSRTRHRGEDDPAEGRTWGKHRQIRAQLLRQLLTEEGSLDQSFGRPLAVRLRGVSVSGPLNLGGLTLRCSLELYDCYLGAGLDLANAEAPAISLRGSHRRRRLSGRRLRLRNTLNLTGGFQCRGRTDLRHAHIGGTLDCTEARFSNPSGVAFAADGLTVTGNVVLTGTQATGEARLLGAHVGGQLDCTGATFSNPGADALSADRLTVTETLNLESVQATGEVRLIGAHVSGQLGCIGATLSNPGGVALNLAGAEVTRDVVMRPAHLDGAIDLRAARAGEWSDDRDTWPTELYLDRFVYDAINTATVTPLQRLDWLRRNKDGYLPQPYEQLASAYRRAGNDRDARTVAVAKQQARRAQPTRWWVRWPSRVWSFALRRTIGYGYRPALALPYLAGLFVLGWIVFDRAYPTELRPAKSGSEQPGFNPARYTVDLLLPVANLHQRDAFVPYGYAAWWTFGLTFAGWLLAAVIVAGLTGVFKRD